MSKRANPTLVGAFVIGAVLVAVVGLILLGGGELFHRKHPFILYFEENVSGLSVGSPVKFQGVQIGSVTGIRLRLTVEGPTMIIPVSIVLDQDLIESRSGMDVSFEQARLQKILDLGLRGRLETDSLLTGQLYVGLELAPGTPIKLLGEEPGMPEIPTLPAAFGEIHRTIDRLAGLDLEGMVKNLVETSHAIRELVASTEAQAVPAAILRTLTNIDTAVAALQAQVEPLGARAADTSQAIERIASAVETTMQTLRPALESLRKAADRTTEVEDELSQTLSMARGLLGPDAPLVVQLQATVQEFGATARSLRALTELIERDPSALVRGKDLPSKP